LHTKVAVLDAQNRAAAVTRVKRAQGGIVGEMTILRNRIGSRLDARSEQSNVEKPPTRKFPVQQTIYKLQKGLDAFNERITELEGERHTGRAMEVLKQNALDLARQIDELRSVLVQQATKTRE
jgi:L-arabinose isomerase